jgi:lysophospholipid hydrolase
LLTRKQDESHKYFIQFKTEPDDEDDELATDDESSPTESTRKKRERRGGGAEQSLMDVVKKMKLFSYLSAEALPLCLQYVEYIDLDNGESLFERNEYDGSLYAVVTGGVRTYFHDYQLPEDEPFDNEDDNRYEERLLSFSSKSGDIVTPLLAILAGLIQEENKKEDIFNILPFVSGVSGVATAPKTRLIRVPPQCFSAVLNKFPADVLRLVQTTLTRVQRVAVLTLVGRLGLRKELLKAAGDGFVTLSPDKQWAESLEWKRLASTLAEKDLRLKENLDSVKCDASVVAALLLGIESGAETESMKLYMEQSSVIFLSKGDSLVETGKPLNAAYLLLHGEMETGIALPTGGLSPSSPGMLWSFHRHKKVQAGSFLDTLGCFTGELSLFTIRCSNELPEGCVLLKIPKNVLDNIMVRHPRVMTRFVDNIISSTSPVVHLLNWNSEWKQLKASEGIVQRGDLTNSMFIVLNGRLRASYRRTSSSPSPHSFSSSVKSCDEYGRGKCVGDVNCLTGSPWPCDVYAIRNSDVAVIPLRTLVVIIRAFPAAGLHFARAIASQVQPRSVENLVSQVLPRSIERLPSDNWRDFTNGPALPSYGLKLATVAVVPLTLDVALSDFCTRLTSSLKEIAPTKLMTKIMARDQLGESVYRSRDAMHDLKMTQLLGDLEENNRLVVYQADLKYTWWTKLCIQQADCILLVVSADQAPQQHRVEQCLAWAHESMDVRIDLVVVVGQVENQNLEADDEDDYDKDDEMNVSDQLNNWSEQRRWIAGHHLVRYPFRRFELDFRRMCRRVTGRSVGLVLGGGGARGMAHLGVIRALKEAGVTVDMVGGTSQGAFCGALYAKHPDDTEMLYKTCCRMAKTMGSMKEKLFDLTLPMTSIFGGRRFNHGIRKALGKTRIQDLVLNFFCVSVDIQKRKQVVHTKGLLWKYVRASMSLTGYLPPVAENGSLLVDGGYLNIVPADVMRDQMGARTVISVDVAAEQEREYYDYGLHLSGWWVLWNSLNPFVKTVKVPSMGDISDMLVWVSADRHRKTVVLSASDLHLKPPVQQYGTLEYDKFDEIILKGYEHAKPIVDAWVEQNPWVVSNEPQGHVKVKLD